MWSGAERPLGSKPWWWAWRPLFRQNLVQKPSKCKRPSLQWSQTSWDIQSADGGSLEFQVLATKQIYKMLGCVQTISSAFTHHVRFWNQKEGKNRNVIFFNGSDVPGRPLVERPPGSTLWPRGWRWTGLRMTPWTPAGWPLEGSCCNRRPKCTPWSDVARPQWPQVTENFKRKTYAPITICKSQPPLK